MKFKINLKRFKRKTKPKIKTIWKPNAPNRLQAFCSITGLPGFAYIVKKDTTRYEKLFWFIVVAVGIITCLIMANKNLMAAEEGQTTVMYESLLYPMLKIPTPGLTICNINMISKHRALHLANTLKRPKNMTTEELLNIFQFVRDVHNRSKQLDKILNMNNMHIDDFVDAIQIDCIEFFLSNCILSKEVVNCAYLFRPLYIFHKKCCAFNFYAIQERVLKIPKTYAQQHLSFHGTGTDYGIRAFIYPNESDYFGSELNSKGFYVYLHHHLDMPDTAVAPKLLSTQYEHLLSYEGIATIATDRLKSTPKNKRRCSLSKDTPNKFLKRGSLKNCLYECKNKLIRKNCGNLFLFKSSKNGDNYTFDSGKCTIEQYVCEQNFRNEIKLNPLIISKNCGCKEYCENIDYKMRLRSSRIHENQKIFNGSYKSIILLNFFMGDLTTILQRRDLISITWIEMYGLYGGLFGLIMGFSIVSVLEFIYILLSHPFLNINRNNLL